MINSPVQKIKERLSIEDVISLYIKLDKAGSNLKANCPFHNEKTPSFFVSPDRGSYYCFGCGAKGDIFSFVEEFEGLDFRGALKILASKAGVVLEEYNTKEESEKERLYRVMEEASKYYSNNLKNDIKILEYLKSRGLMDSTILDFRIGFAKNDWRELFDYLKTKNFSDKEIETAGLVKKSEKSFSSGGQGFYDRFRGRIMFPISDSSGRIIAFSGRLFLEDGKSAKYLNSPDTPIFSKSSVLYGLDKAKESIRKNNFSILVEGQFDLVLSHQAGFKNTIATSGTAFTEYFLPMQTNTDNTLGLNIPKNILESIDNTKALSVVKRISNNIVFAFDADKAGVNAAVRASKIALSLDMDVKVAKMPDGIDPADLILKSGKDAWRESIRNSKHIIEFLLDRILNNKTKDLRYIGREIKEKILPYVDSINSAIEKAHFIKLISDMSQIKEEALKEDLKKIEQESKFEKRGLTTNNISLNEFNSEKIFKRDYILRRLFGIILWQRTLKEQVLDIENILKEIADILKIKIDEIFEKIKSNEEDLIFEAEVFYTDNVNLKKDVLELLFNLKEEYLKEELASKMHELRIYEMGKKKIRDTLTEDDIHKDKSNEILKEIEEINNKIQNIKNSRIKI